MRPINFQQRFYSNYQIQSQQQPRQPQNPPMLGGQENRTQGLFSVQENQNISFGGNFNYGDIHNIDFSSIESQVPTRQNLLGNIMNIFGGSNHTQGIQQGPQQPQAPQQGQMGGNNQFSQGAPTNLNPEEFAKQYAQQNNLSIEDAREALRAQYGDPQAPNMQQGFGINQNYPTSLEYTSLGFGSLVAPKCGENQFQDNLTSNIGNTNQQQSTDSEDKSFVEGNPDEYVKQYAKENNITIEEATEILKELYGEPEGDYNPFG